MKFISVIIVFFLSLSVSTIQNDVKAILLFVHNTQTLQALYATCTTVEYDIYNENIKLNIYY